MKMKNYKALFALLIIGLLVITGCSDFLNPPTRPAAGGTLLVSINGADGRTILPLAQLDKYVLELFTGPDGDVPYGGPRDLSGSTAIGLPAGTYTVVVKGYVDGEVVAEGTEAGVVVTDGQVATATIVLTAAADGEGTFSWDFTTEEEAVTGVEINIYGIEDDDDETDLAGDSNTGVTGSITLDAGVYSVKFTVSVTGEGGPETFTWREVLYIYKGLTSKYGVTDLIAREVLPPIYQVPASGNGYFYLNLNNWDTQSPSSTNIENTVPEGELASDGLTATFTKQAQRISIKLSAAQVALLYASAGPISITIEGSATPDGPFRTFFVDAMSGNNYNATGAFFDGAFSTGTSTKLTQAFNGNKSELTLGYLTFQFDRNNANPVETEVTINSIKVEYPIYNVPAATGDKFYLNLNDWETVTPPDANINSTLPAGTLESDKLTLEFTENNQRVNIGLTAAQITALTTASNITVTIDGSATPDTQFRYHIGDPSTGSNWPATSGTGAAAFSTIKTGNQTIDAVANLKHFILQQRETATTTVVINSILIEYESLAEVLPDDGTELANLDDIDGLQGASAKYKQRDDGGLYVYDRTQDWHSVDLQVIYAADVDPLKPWEIPLEPTSSYRITVKGRAVATATGKAEIVQAERPWGSLESKNLTEFGQVGKIVNFDIAATKTGAEILARNDGNNPVTDPNRPRIRVMDTGNPPYIIDSVELIEWDAEEEETTGPALIAFNIPDVLDLTGTELEDLDAISGIMGAGNAKFKTRADGALIVYDRPNDYSTIDLQLFLADDDPPSGWKVIVDSGKSYRLTVTGEAVAFYDQKAEIVQGASPYNTHAVKPLTDFGAVNTIVEFEVEAIKTGAVFQNPNTRIRVSGTQDFVITSIVLIEFDDEDEEDVGTALISFGTP